MEASRVALGAFACVMFFRISAVDVELRVRAGDNVTLYCDRVYTSGLYAVWFRNCSEKDHPSVVIDIKNYLIFPYYLVVLNASTNAFDLLINNISKSDEGLYYCALSVTEITDDKHGFIQSNVVYYYGNRSTRLSVLAEPRMSVCVSEASVHWTLVLSVCSACVLVSSLLSSMLVYCLCLNTAKARIKASLAGRDKRTSQRHEELGEDEVCYVSLDIQNLQKAKRTRTKMIVPQSEFSTYSEVRTERS